MTTWRERIAEAVGRETRILGVCLWPGRFTDADRRAWANYNTCPVGEVAAAYGLNRLDLNAVGNFSLRFLETMDFFPHRPRLAARILDEIEDAALDLKRRA